MIVYNISRQVGNYDFIGDLAFRNEQYSLFGTIVSSEVLLLWGHAASHWESHLGEVDWHHAWHLHSIVGAWRSVGLVTSLHQHLLLDDLLLEHSDLLLLVHHDGLADQGLLLWRKLGHVGSRHSWLTTWHSTEGTCLVHRHHGVRAHLSHEVGHRSEAWVSSVLLGT